MQTKTSIAAAMAFCLASCAEPETRSDRTEIVPETITVEKTVKAGETVTDTEAPDSIVVRTGKTRRNISLASVLGKMRPAVQEFTIPASGGAAIRGKKGTGIKIPGSAFVDREGNPVSGNVKISLTEFISTPEILAAKMTTATTDGRLLETAGMILLEASAGGEKLRLAEGKTVGLDFPAARSAEGFQMFSGSEGEDGSVVWTATSVADRGQSDFVTVPISAYRLNAYPVPRGGTEQFARYILAQPFPPELFAKNAKGSIRFYMRVGKDGKISEPVIRQGYHPVVDSIFVKGLRKMPDWIPGKLGNEAVECNYESTMTFMTGENMNYFEMDFSETKAYIDFDYALMKNASPSYVSDYAFSVNQLGLINCDRFYEDDRPKKDFFVSVPDTRNTEVRLVFKKIRSFMTGVKTAGSFAFAGLPEGEEVRVVAIAPKGENILLSVTESRVGEVPVLSFEELSVKDFQRRMASL